MPHEITSARIRLRQLAPDEARALLEGRPDPARPWARGYPTEGTFTAVEAFVRAASAGAEPSPYGVYQLVRLDDEAVIGDIGFFGPPSPTGVVTVGYGLAASARGKGYATEALRALTAWALAQPGVRRIEADTTHANVPSQRVMERVGMRLVGQDDQLRYYALP
ncbi:MAG TPA: GNAT family N-acetyltransferase [Actinomycetota bacterium]|nr:GNAT family N-acetyltransferase [Actinomycetota bacterium]